MAFFISHVQPLWSFAAPLAEVPDAGLHDAGCFHIRGPIVWSWTRGEDGRPERRWTGGSRR